MTGENVNLTNWKSIYIYLYCTICRYTSYHKNTHFKTQIEKVDSSNESEAANEVLKTPHKHGEEWKFSCLKLLDSK